MDDVKALDMLYVEPHVRPYGRQVIRQDLRYGHFSDAVARTPPLQAGGDHIAGEREGHTADRRKRGDE